MPQPNKLIAVLLVCIGLLRLSVTANPLDNWNWRYPLPQGNSLSDVAYGAAKYVAVGDFGTIVSSPDGLTWTQQNSDTLAALHAVTFADGLFVAVGDFGTILTSTDGETWSHATVPDFTALLGVTRGSGLYIAVGDQGRILSSADAIHWNVVNSGNFALEDVTFGNGVFVAVGGTFPTNRFDDGQPIILTSANAHDWVNRTSSVPSRVYKVCFAQQTFVALTGKLRAYNTGIPSISTSTNGEQWESSVATGQFYFYLSDVAFGDGRFVTVSPGAINLYSTDARTWTTNNHGQPPTALNALTWGPFGFVAVGPYGVSARSQDGITWTDCAASLPGILVNIGALEYGNGTFLAVTEHFETNRYNVIWRSEDGISWERSLAPRFGGLRFGNGLFAAVQEGALITSANGIDWISRDTGLDHLSTILYCNGLWVALYCETLLTSIDTMTWIRHPFLPLRCAEDLVYGNGRFAALLSDGGIAISEDLASWFTTTSPRFRTITFGHRMFLGLTYEGEIWTSPDGIAWTLRVALPQPSAPEVTSHFIDVTFGAGIFVAVGGDARFGGVYGDETFNARIFTSHNGISWTERPMHFNDALKHVVYGDSSFVVVGYRSEVFLQCGPFAALRARDHGGDSRSGDRRSVRQD